MFCAGRGWYYRSSETALWQPDTRRIMLGKVQAHPEREKCQRGFTFTRHQATTDTPCRRATSSGTALKASTRPGWQRAPASA